MSYEGVAERLVRIQHNLQEIIERYDDDPDRGGDWLQRVKKAEACVSDALISSPPGFSHEDFYDE